VTAQELAASIESRLREAGDRERAEREKRYLKSELEHVGASVPATRKIVKAAIADHHRALTHEELVELVSTLWGRRVHECRMAAVELLERHREALRPADIELIEQLLRESRTWALVDGLAASVAGDLVQRYPELASTLDRWSADADFWLRRSALLALLLALRRGAGDFDRFGRYADAMLAESEFFIQKAIGWVLRDTSRKRPELVYRWLEPRAARASAVTIREAVKHLSGEQRDQIAAARQAASAAKRAAARAR
jgi:3-methyladenine DNA glycosylase AlkD